MNIPLFKIYWDENDVERVTSVIRRGMYWAIGPEILEFENVVREYIGVKYAVAVNSGTSALHVALAAHGIGEGDEVIVPSFTFIATANAPLFVGARPVFAEIEGVTYGLDPSDVEKRITPRTKAIIPVHYGGCPCRIVELEAVARRHNLILIEDAAEAFGASVDGRKVGTFGDSAIVSFCAPKLIATGEGGMVLTNSRSVCERAKLICNHGRAETADYFSSTEQMDYVALGYNFRMSSMTAALGLARMDKADEMVRMTRENASWLTEGLSHISEVAAPTEPSGMTHLYQLYTLRVQEGEQTRDSLKRYLQENGVAAKVYFEPVHLSKFYRTSFGYRGGELPCTERIARQVLTLPTYPTLTRREIEYMVDLVNSFFLKGGRR